MTAAEVASALDVRKTVRITYNRTTELHRVDIALGRVLLDVIRVGILSEELAEHYAANAARVLGFDVTRVDVN